MAMQSSNRPPRPPKPPVGPKKLRNQATAGKSNPKAALPGKGSLPKATTMKSRGSKTAAQMGSMNQKEAIKQKGNPSMSGTKTYRPTKTMATSVRGKLDQAAGGSKNLSERETNAKNAGKTRASDKAINMSKGKVIKIAPSKRKAPSASSGGSTTEQRIKDAAKQGKKLLPYNKNKAKQGVQKLASKKGTGK
jgi:hypothetical protein